MNRTDDLAFETSLNDNPFGFVMPHERSSNIDNIESFLHAEWIMHELGGPMPNGCARGFDRRKGRAGFTLGVQFGSIDFPSRAARAA